MPAFRFRYKLSLSLRFLPFISPSITLYICLSPQICQSLLLATLPFLPFYHLSIFDSANTSFHPSLLHPSLPQPHSSLTSFLSLFPFISTTSWRPSSTPLLPSFHLSSLTELYTKHHSCICQSTHYSQSRGDTHILLQIGTHTLTSSYQDTVKCAKSWVSIPAVYKPSIHVKRCFDLSLGPAVCIRLCRHKSTGPHDR